MAQQPIRRKVLIVEDQPSIRNVLYVLLAGMGYDGDVATGAKMALSMIQQASFDAVLLDLRCSDMPADEVVAKIKGLRPSLVDRVLVITGEVTDPQTLEVIERNCIPHVPRNRVTDELWDRLRSLLGLSHSSADTSS